jgi:hypothetical protein
MHLFRSSLAAGAVLLVFAAGCTPTPPTAGGKDDKPVRDAFVAFQAALKAHDGDKIWGLLDADSQAGAERAGKAVNLNGKEFVKSDHFCGQKELKEVAEGKVKKVSLLGDKATVTYDEGDGDEEKLKMVREGGQWKVSAPMP